jgi:hypothetical protein
MNQLEFAGRFNAFLAGRNENQFLFVYDGLRGFTYALGEKHHVIRRLGHPRARAARSADETHVSMEHLIAIIANPSHGRIVQFVNPDTAT